VINTSIGGIAQEVLLSAQFPHYVDCYDNSLLLQNQALLYDQILCGTLHAFIITNILKNTVEAYIPQDNKSAFDIISGLETKSVYKSIVEYSRTIMNRKPEIYRI
jgi:hypothetical protein